MTIFKQKIIAFVDILGFKNFVKNSESGIGFSLSELINLVNMLGSKDDQHKMEQNGSSICPASNYIDQNLDFKITQISDCVIVSAEVSPAGVINLVNHCWQVAIRLLQEGILCRGYIQQGMIYHSDSQVIGTGYQEAYKKESKVSAFQRGEDSFGGTPFIEIDASVLNYINQNCDDCVKERFNIMVLAHQNITAIYPFKRLSHSFAFGGMFGEFDYEREFSANERMKQSILKYKEKIQSLAGAENKNATANTEKEKVRVKVAYYLEALDEQLMVCNRTEEGLNLMRQEAVRVGYDSNLKMTYY